VRVDYHIVQERHHWDLQSAQGASLAVFESAEDALVAARGRALDMQQRGLGARVVLHHRGTAPEVFDYPL
jgi:hypothetical protein